MLRMIDAASRFAGTLAAWAYFIIALMLGYEVIMRALGSPTIWAEELSRLLLVWATFGGAAVLLHRRQHIVITLLTDHLSPALRRIQEVAVLLCVALFVLAIAYKGFGIAFDSLSRGRTTGSMLDLPAWWAQLSLPLCFALLGFQALAEALRTWINGVDPNAQQRLEH